MLILLECMFQYLKQDIDMVICDWLSVTDNDNYMTAAVDWVFNKENVYEQYKRQHSTSR